MVTSTAMETRITRKRRWQSLPDKKTARTSLNFDEAENTPPRKRRAIDVENSPSNSSSENESAEESFNIKSFYGGRQKKNFPHSPRRRKAAGKILSKLSDENSASAEENSTLTSENGSSPDSNRSMVVLRNRKSSTNAKEESSKIGLSVKPVTKNNVTPNNKKRGTPVVAEVPENKTPTSGKKFFKHKSPASTSKLVGSSIIVQKGFNLKFVPRCKSSSADLKEKKKPPQSKFPRKVSKTVTASKTGDDINITKQTPVTNGENNTPDSATNSCLAVSDVSVNNPVSITNNPVPVLSNSLPVSSSHSEGGCSDSFVTGSELTGDNSNTVSEVISDDGSITDLSSLSSGPTLRSRGTTSTEGKKYFSIFNSTHSSPRSSPEQVSKGVARKFVAKSSPRMSPRLRIRPDKDSKDQMILDAGQKQFGATQCDVCGMVYTPDDPIDKTTHAKFHQSLLMALRFPGWKKERVVQEYPELGSRVIMVLYDDPKYAIKKVEDINKIMGQEMGFPEASMTYKHGYKVFLYISEEKTVEGCCVAEPVSQGYRVIADSQSSQSSQPGHRPMCCQLEPQPATVGISRIWVHSQQRKKGIATKLLDCVRQRFEYGFFIEKKQMAFSDPTPDGKLLATKYTGTPNFLVYKYG